jgi:hypothetical protein
MSLRAASVLVAALGFAAPTSAQTAPLPDLSSAAPTGFLTRSAWFFSVAGVKSDDPRFSEMARSRVDVDVFHHDRGRVNQFFDVDLVMGSEHRSFDLNHANVIFETSASYRLASLEISGVFHHTSRHLVDREFGRVVAWHTLAARVERVFMRRRSYLAIAGEIHRVVQRTYVDYTWTNQGTVRIDRLIGNRAHVFAAGSGGVVSVDPGVVGRDSQKGARVEGGMRIPGQRAALDLFAAYERRVDGYPIAREPSSWVEIGFRLGGR